MYKIICHVIISWSVAILFFSYYGAAIIS